MLVSWEQSGYRILSFSRENKRTNCLQTTGWFLSTHTTEKTEAIFRPPETSLIPHVHMYSGHLKTFNQMYVYMYWRTHLHKHIHELTDKLFTLTCYLILFTMVSSFPWAFLKALVHLVFRGLRFLLNALWHFNRQNLKIWYQPRNNIHCTCVSLHRQLCQPLTQTSLGGG